MAYLAAGTAAFAWHAVRASSCVPPSLSALSPQLSPLHRLVMNNLEGTGTRTSLCVVCHGKCGEIKTMAHQTTPSAFLCTIQQCVLDTYACYKRKRA